MGAIPLYRCVDAALLRATTAPQAPPRPVDLSLVDGDVEAIAVWIAATWADTALAAAVSEASPDLARQIRAVGVGEIRDLRRLRRAALALARYDARWRGRATPFGLFAGVAPLRVADRCEVEWSGRHRPRHTADGRWLAAVIGQLESDAVLRCRLAVVRSDLAVPCGDRLVVPVPVGRGARAASASVRLTPLVARVLEVADSSIEVGRLVHELAGDGPVAGAVADVVGVLLAIGVLISSLTPPSTVVDGAAHLLERLGSLPADAVAGVEPLVAEIAAVVAGPPVAPGRMPSGADRTGPVWRTDVRLGCAVALPAAVVDEAAAAAEVLLRWSPAPAGHPAWLRFHARFLDRYGSGAVVALLDVLDPVTGVGPPEHLAIEDPDVEPDERTMTPRDRLLLRLAQHAALDGVRQVKLDDQQCGELPTAGESVGPPHVDVCFDVRAASTAQLDGGGFTIGVSSVGPSAVATVGRFLGVVDALERERMISEFGRLPVAVDGARPVQVSFPALRLPARTAATAPVVLERVVAVGEHAQGGALTAHDLAVTADHRRLYLVSRRDGRVVETVAVNALARHATPVLARVLLELPRATTATITGWNWGAAGCLPFRPRVRHGRAVLAPAAWTLPPADSMAATGARRLGRAAVDRLRERHRWPRFVHVGHSDQQLRLDLDNSTDVDLLREHLGRGVGLVTVTEAPSPADHGWLDGRAHEVVVPLATTAAPVAAPWALIRRPCVVIARDHGELPGAAASGTAVLSARLTCRPAVVDAIVVEHLPALLDRFEVAPHWWFLRHRTPAAFLRLRLHVPRYGEAAERVGAWASQLRRLGLSGDLVLDTYRPELARYGASAAARAAVERVFAADSAVARAQLALIARQRQADPLALTAASMIDLVTAARGGRAAGLAWLVERSDLADRAQRTDRAQLDQVLDLLDPASPHRELEAPWRDRAEAVRRYADLSFPEALADTVLVSLLHLHHVRALGVDPAGEARCHRLARAAALSLLARPSRSETA